MDTRLLFQISEADLKVEGLPIISVKVCLFWAILASKRGGNY